MLQTELYRLWRFWVIKDESGVLSDRSPVKSVDDLKLQKHIKASVLSCASLRASQKVEACFLFVWMLCCVSAPPLCYCCQNCQN